MPDPVAPSGTRPPAVARSPFGTLPDGRAVERFVLTGPGAVEVGVLDYGGIVTSVRAPDRDGRVDDVALGHDTLAGYLPNKPYLGAAVGRYANRIAGGRFTLDGVAYALPRNDGPNTLHGGLRGFDRALWAAAPFADARGAGVVLRHTSPDGDEGFPGALEARVTYTLGADGALAVDYEATAGRATPVNLTHHGYWDLAGAARVEALGNPPGDVLGHVLMVAADAYLPVDATLIPTGERRAVAGTPFDFRAPTPIGARVAADDEQLRRGGGYDHCWVLTRGDDEFAHAARVVEPRSGRTLDVWTTEPGLQFYSGNALDGSVVGRGGRRYDRRAGFALETQHFPDSPNRPEFPSTILRPGETYRSRTVFVLGVEGS